MAKKYCYLFTEGNANMRELLGGKGANLAEMTNIGLPVPQGFTISTEACTQYYEDGRQINDEIMAEIMTYIEKMEEITGKKFGDEKNPLLVSVRSGARASMPGMMDTILNLGLNETVVNTIATMSGNPRWAWDCYRRFIQMYSDVVMEVGKKYFEQLIDKMKEEKGVHFDVELTAEDLRTLANQFKAEYKEKIGADFPDDPKEQLLGAIKAVFRSWDNPRANVYRRDNDIPYSWGTAVNVQMMAFGNMGDDCGTGVAFTRDPATGEKHLMGEFLPNAQGEDVVAGVRTPLKIEKMAELFPEAFAQFTKVCEILENHYRDMQDMEFTVEHGKLYMLQTRNGKRTAKAALKIACDLVDEGMRTKEEAVLMIDPRNLDTLLHPQFDAKALKAATPIGRGLGGRKIDPDRTVLTAVENPHVQPLLHDVLAQQVGLRLVVDLVEIDAQRLVGNVETVVHPAVHHLPQSVDLGIPGLPAAQHLLRFEHQRRPLLRLLLRHARGRQLLDLGLVVPVELDVVFTDQMVALHSRRSGRFASAVALPRQHRLADVDAAVVDQVDLDDVMADGTQYLRDRIAQQVVADMPQMERLVGIGRRILDHHVAARRRSLPERSVGCDFGETVGPEAVRKSEVQESLDDVERLHLRHMRRKVLPYLGGRRLGRLAASSQQRENDQRIIAVELLACLLNLQLLLPKRPVERLDRAAHRLRNKVIDIHFPLMIC